MQFNTYNFFFIYPLPTINLDQSFFKILFPNPTDRPKEAVFFFKPYRPTESIVNFCIFHVECWHMQCRRTTFTIISHTAVVGRIIMKPHVKAIPTDFKIWQKKIIMIRTIKLASPYHIMYTSLITFHGEHVYHIINYFNILHILFLNPIIS